MTRRRRDDGIFAWRRSLPWPITLGFLLATFAVAVAALVRDPKQADQPAPSPVAAPTQDPLPAGDVTIPTTSDAYVDESSPTVIFGRTAKLRIDGQPTVNALLQFDLRGLNAPVKEAALRIFSTSGSAIGFQARLVHVGAWDERDMTFGASEHPVRRDVAYSGAFNTGSWANADITRLISGLEGRVVTIALSTSGPTNISFASSDGAAPAPRIAITLGQGTGTKRTAPPKPSRQPATQDAVDVLAAGDIATCDGFGDEKTGAILNAHPAWPVLVLGDIAYESGSADEFARCYEPSWGPAKHRTRPVPGNHEYLTGEAGPYFRYFGRAAGDPSRGYYSFDIGAWHAVALNSNCVHVGGCGEGSPQLDWLRQDLAAHPTACTLAFWHHPLFSSGQHGGDTAMEPIWRALTEAGVDIALTGHDHDYERFAPQDETGRADDARGVREFVVGTGGKGLRPVGAPWPNSQARGDQTAGVLRLTLGANTYDWQFLPVSGGSYTDSGSADCH